MPDPAPPPTAPAHRPTAGSALVRAACLAYLSLILYGSLTPFRGWRDNGVPAFAYLLAPWPAHVTAFDLVVNLVAYLPLGALLVLSLPARWRGVAAVLAATCGGVGLSIAVEATQTFLPTRVASQVDVLTNGLGTLLGALLAERHRLLLAERWGLARLRITWFDRDAAVPLVLLLLWPAAQIHPGPMLFGDGSIEPLAQALRAWLPAPAPFGPPQFIAAEAVVAFTGWLAAAALLGSVSRPRAPRLLLLSTLLAGALAVKALAYGVTFGAEHGLDWLTPGAQWGLGFGLAGLAAVCRLRATTLAPVAALALFLLLLLANAVPANPYHAAWLAAWRPGHLLHFDAAAGWLAAAWPCAALLWLLARTVPDRRRGG